MHGHIVQMYFEINLKLETIISRPHVLFVLNMDTFTFDIGLKCALSRNILFL
jgi:hypothetical protein